MTSKGREAGTRSGGARSATRREWIGGRLSPPFVIQEESGTRPAELAVWMDARSGLLIRQEATEAGNGGDALLRLLRDALERPERKAGGPPSAIRVSDPSLVSGIRAIAGETIPVRVAPTPELDALLEFLIESIQREDEQDSYLQGGRLSPEAVGAMFSAARLLHREAPWEAVSDEQVLRMDIPALDVDGACVTIVGALGQSRGFLIFPSHEGFETFVENAGVGPAEDGALDLGTGFLSLGFERHADLPASMRREIMRYGWAVDGRGAHPCVERYDRKGRPEPLVERDLRIATACAAALATFVRKHREKFLVGDPEPSRELFLDLDDLPVRLTFPFAAPVASEHGPDRVPTEHLSLVRDESKRNDPCPCGSGRKYKKCHLLLEEGGAPAQQTVSPGHELDARLVALPLRDPGSSRRGSLSAREGGCAVGQGSGVAGGTAGRMAVRLGGHRR